jgi:YVTN family beta-propeller protein
MAQASASWAAPFAWLAHQSPDRLARLDLATHETVSVAVCTNAISSAASDDGLRAYANCASQTISVVDAPSMTVVATVPLPSAPYNVAVRRDGAKVYAGLGEGTIAVIDGGTNSLLPSISIGSFTAFGAIVTNAANTRAYMTKNDGTYTSVAVIDTVNDTFVADVLLTQGFDYPLGVAISPDGTRLYATVFGNPDVFVIDATNDQPLPPIVLSTAYGAVQPNGLAVSPDGATVYVTEQFVDRLAVVDAATATEITSVAVGNTPTVVDVTPDGSRAYVVNTSSSTVSILDTATNTIVGTVLTVNDFPTAGERFIAPGTTTTSTSSPTTSTTSSSTSSTLATTTTGAPSTTTTSTLPPPPLLSTTAIACQKTLALSFKRFGAKAHGVFVTCYQRVLSAVASGGGTSAATGACLADLDPGIATSKVNRLRTSARNQILARCGALGPADLAQPCDARATTMTEVADCVLDAQLDRVAGAVAAEYGRPCSMATVAGLATVYPALCP